MSPLTVRRYRAERLLRDEFEALRGSVIARVRSRLRGSGVSLDQSDLEACYATAWQGLYATVLEGQEIDSPAGWLVQVTFRRAIDEHRARGRVDRDGERVVFHSAETRQDGDIEAVDAHQRDIAAALDDRARLRQLFEGLRGRLGVREREAAVLCYLQGLSRAQAAERMGVSDARMRKLMEGGNGRAGVARKVSALVETIRDGGWCEEQGSLMRALAYGILDPDGERYQLALMHRSECPSCRAYVTSLRGLAATLPPVFLPWSLGGAVLARAAQAHGGAVAGTAGGGTGAVGGAASGGGAIAASGAAGGGVAGVAGGGWLFAGGAKLAAGCVLALSVGAGCVALGVGVSDSHSPAHPHRSALASSSEATGAVLPVGGSIGSAGAVAAATVTPPASSTLGPAARASREFGPEQAFVAAARQAHGGEGDSVTPTARIASSPSTATAGSSSAGQSSSAGSSALPTGASAAEREFSPG